MKLWVSEYLLTPKTVLNSRTTLAPRQGALLKAETKFGVGYGDFHPWPEFGDASLADQLATIEQGGSTSLYLRTVALLLEDARARAEGRFLLNLQPLRNNASWSFASEENDEQQIRKLQANGYRVVKVKCGRDLVKESEVVQRLAQASPLRIRLDFNASIPGAEFERFQESVPQLCDRAIEYVEDPCAYDAKFWNQIRKRWKVALDFEIDSSRWNQDIQPAADVLILKPARTDVEEAVEKCARWGMGITVTSMMDHPVGVAHAASVALNLRQRGVAVHEEAGCLTTSMYEDNEFSKRISITGPELSFSKGLGVGFDDLLEAQPWRSLITA